MCLHANMEAEEAMTEHGEAAHADEKYCALKACDSVCVCLNYLAQRPDRGANEVRSSLLQRFSSLYPSIFTPSTHQPSCSFSSIAAELLVYSSCLYKQEVSNKRLSTCYSRPLNYQQAMREEHRSN